MQAGLAEVADRPGVVVGGGERCLPAVQPGNTGTVYEVWPTDLTSRETSVRLSVRYSSPRVGVVGVPLRVQVIQEHIHLVRG